MKSSNLLKLKSQLSDSNQPKHNSLFAQINFVKDQTLDGESITSFIVDSNFDNIESSMNNSKLLLAFMTIKTKIEATKQLNK